jgi:hypothetical protein
VNPRPDRPGIAPWQPHAAARGDHVPDGHVKPAFRQAATATQPYALPSPYWREVERFGGVLPSGGWRPCRGCRHLQPAIYFAGKLCVDCRPWPRDGRRYDVPEVIEPWNLRRLAMAAEGLRRERPADYVERIARLTPRQAQAVELHRDGQGAAAIGRETDTSKQAAAALLERAYRRMLEPDVVF